MIKLRPWKGTKNEFEADIIVTGPNGRTLRKRVKAPVAGKSNAERWARSLEQEMLVQLLAPEPEPEKPLAPTFEVFAVLFMDLCKANRLGKNTLMNYDIHLRLYLLPVLGKRRLDEVKPADLTALKASLSTKARSTMTEVLKSLRRLFTVAIEQGLIAREPVKLDIPARIHKSPIAYDDADQQALLAAAQALGPEYVAMVLLGIDGGLRRGEILGLQWSDLNLARASMTIRHNLVRGTIDVPKGRTEDEVGMTRRLVGALTAIRHRRGPFVFSTESGEHYKEHHIKRWMEQLVEKGKLTWHGTHVLRKTCGTRIADGGGGVSAVASHLRHKSLQTASRYIDRRGAGSRALNALES
ncbi:MAG: site-specific integrase [Nannocystis sp.]|nr:site-specific integrase [Nannocystis sp.]MBA3544974.1 site-specific integrase [Nannocystis sp.]